MSIYLDNAATTFPKPESVYIEMDRFMRMVGASPGRGGYQASIEASRTVFETRELLCELFNGADSSRFILTHSATEALNMALYGLLSPGDHVVTGSMEHNSVARPLHDLSKKGVNVTWVQADCDGYLDVNSVKMALRPETRLVVLNHSSNVTGAVVPAVEIGSMLKEHGVPFMLDASQSAGALPLDIVAMGIDFLAAAGHKGLYGPQGTGFLYMAEGADVQPLIFGGTGSNSSELESPAVIPERFEAGSQNMPGIAGLGAALRHIRSIGVAGIEKVELDLVFRIIEGLKAINGLTVFNASSDRSRGGVVSFNIAGMDPAAVAYRLDRDFDIAVRSGLHCAPLAHKTIGTFPAGTVRVSPGIFNSRSDVECLLEAVKSVVGK